MEPPNATEDIQGVNGVTLRVRSWEAERPRALVVYCHGICVDSRHEFQLSTGEFVGMNPLAACFAKAGFHMVNYDQQGHGASTGTRAYLEDWTTYVADFKNVAIHVSTKYPTLPVFLMGESFGGGLCIVLSQELWESKELPNFKGALLIAPAIEGDFPPRPVVLALTQIARFFPTRVPFFMPNPVGIDRCVDDDNVQKQYRQYAKEDPYNAGNPFRLGTGVQLLNMITHIQNEVLKEVTYPFRIAHAENDVAVPISGSRRMIAESSTENENKELKTFDCLHSISLSKEMTKVVTYFSAEMDKMMQQ